MMKRFRILVIAGSLLVGIACADSTTEPSFRYVTERDGLRMEVAIDTRVIAVGDSAAITYTLRNLTADPVRLSFGSSCQITPFVETSRGAVEYPAGGSWGCLTVLTSLDVPAQGVVTQRLVVQGVDDVPMGPGPWLRRGGYRTYALLAESSRELLLKSPTISFEVR
jgi:hypothetical protein